MSPPPSLRRVASLAGASLAATSKALHGSRGSIHLSADRRQHIRSVARAHRYRPNDQIALLLPGEARRNGQLLRWVQAVDDAASAAGLTCTTDRNLVRRWKVGGVVILDRAPAGLESELEEQGLPAVWLNPAEDLAVDAVRCDDRPGLEAALERLRLQGALRLALVMPPIAHAAYARRCAVVEAWCAAHHLPWVLADAASFEAALAKVAAAPEPTGWIVLADWWLGLDTWLACSGRAVERRRVATLRSPLSPWLQPPGQILLPEQAMAEAAVALLQRRWNGEDAGLPSVILPAVFQEPPEASP